MSVCAAGRSGVQHGHSETAQTHGNQIAPKGKSKRSYHTAARVAQQNGSATYKGRIKTLERLGGTPAMPEELHRFFQTDESGVSG